MQGTITHMREMIESFLIIAAITGGLIWYALVLARREDGEAGSSFDRGRLREFKPQGKSARQRDTTTEETHDPDAHLGHTGSE